MGNTVEPVRPLRSAGSVHNHEPAGLSLRTARAFRPESLTTSRPWNTSALKVVEHHGRVAMVGFTAAVVGEPVTGHGIVGQLAGLVHWYLQLG